MKKLIQVLEKILKQLEIMNTSKGNCNHELKPLIYFYDDDWGITGSKVWGGHRSNKTEMTLMFCEKCNQVFVCRKDDTK